MALPASGPLSASQISVELGRAAGAAFSMDDAGVRGLAGKPSGLISFSDLLGKSSLVFPEVLSSTINAALSASSRVLSGPACDVGDLLIAMVSHSSGTTSASGWTKFSQKATPYAFSLFYKVADSTSGNLSLSLSSSTSSTGSIFRIKKGTFASPVVIGAAVSVDTADPPQLTSPTTKNTWFALGCGSLPGGISYPLASHANAIGANLTSAHGRCAVLDFEGNTLNPGGFGGFNTLYDRSATIYVGGFGA